MAEMGLVLFDNTIKNTRFIRLRKLFLATGLLKSRLGTRLYLSWKLRKFEIQDEKIELQDQMSFRVMTLPFREERWKDLNTVFILHYLTQVCSSRGIGYCRLPPFIQVPEVPLFLSPWYNLAKLLLKPLLVRILGDLCAKKGIRLGDLDIVLLCNRESDALVSVIRCLEPHLRYITIAAGDKDSVEKKLEGIFTETGLSVSVVGDVRNAIKHADLLIVVDTMELAFRVHSKALVVNLGDEQAGKLFTENMMINGVELDLPKAWQLKIRSGIYKYYSRRELAEIAAGALLLPGGGESRDYGNFAFDDERSLWAARLLNECGFRVSGFRGRRGILRPEMVVKALRTS